MNVDVSKGFNLGCYHYKVLTDERTNDNLRSAMRYGEHSSTMREVRVSDEYAGEYHSTFVHEVIEAVNNIYCADKLEHQEITTLANGLAQVLGSLGIEFSFEDG